MRPAKLNPKRNASISAAIEPIPATALKYLLLSLGLLNALLLLFMPWWVPALGAMCIVWRWLIAQGRLNYPPLWLKSVLAIGCFGGLIAQFGLRPVLDFFLCLLLLSVSLRLLELQQRTAALKQIWIAFFVLMLVFIFEQAPIYGIAVYLIVWLLLAAVIANFSAEHLLQTKPSQPLIKSAWLLLCALPIWLLLFVGMPRMGPLWHMPLKQQAAAKTGMSDSMSPGDIASLSKSDELVMRATFTDAVPPRQELYWLAMYLDRFDGAKWTESCQHCFRLTAPQVSDKSKPYQLILEPHQQHWLYLLQPSQVEGGRYWQAGDIYRSERPLLKRMQLIAYQQLARQERSVDRGRYLQLPAQGNQQTRDWANSLRTQGLSDREVLQTMLRHFQQHFRYTMQPPTLAGDRVDQFLFQTRAGYCEHFASSLVFALRAAGIPARVAVGYMGGEINEDEKLVVVRQHDAHAWAEVWLDYQWQRIDPTAYVAPERIELSFSRYSSAEAGFTAHHLGNWLNQLQRQKDLLDYWWARWILGYDNDDQASAVDKLRKLPWQQGLFYLSLLIASALTMVIGYQLRVRRLSKARVIGHFYRLSLKQYQRAGFAVSYALTPMQNAACLGTHMHATAFSEAAARLAAALYSEAAAMDWALLRQWLVIYLRAALQRRLGWLRG